MAISATSQANLKEQYSRELLGVFGEPSLVLTEGKGCTVTDADGKTYLDLLAGIAVNSLGHAHPEWVAAVQEQAGKLAHISNFFTSEPQLQLAHKLAEFLGDTQQVQSFFCNSGTGANEAAYKLARRYGNTHGKSTILALDHGFHGRSIGALSLTWKEQYRHPFEPMPTGVKHIPATVAALEEHLSDDVAAVIVEPIQGEAGVVPLPEGYLSTARELTRAHGALLIVDEVQTGMGRTGRWFECTRELSGDRLPDVITLAKGLGGGFPIGAMLVIGEQNQKILEPGMHGTTFGGNPLAAAAALATLTVIERQNLREHAQQAGQKVRQQLAQLPEVATTRGAGLLIAIELKQDTTEAGEPLAPACVNAAREAGFIINATGPNTLRLAPPLIITNQELAAFATKLSSIVKTARENA